MVRVSTSFPNLSGVPPMVAPMGTLNEEALHDYLSREGISVVETDLGGIWGYYMRSQARIYIQSGMCTGHRLATLCHEAIHHYRGDSGPQPLSVEREIDEQVAQLLVDPVDYAFFESQLGWHAGGIAAELELPVWVVRAYRRVLRREMVRL